MKFLSSACIISLACLVVASSTSADPAAPERAAKTSSAETAPGAELRVRVGGIESDAGTIRMALFDGAEAYDDDRPMKRQSVEAEPGVVEIVFLDMPTGRYAIATFHDRNANEKLDSNLVGLPTEPYGFSNDARGRFGPPSYDDMEFDLGPDGAVLEIQLR